MPPADKRNRWLARHLDEAALVALFGRIAFGQFNVTLADLPALEALERVAPGLMEGGVGQLGERLREMSPEQIQGLTNNVKGALHEMEFVNLENSDGDQIYARMFDDPHHPDTDVVMTDEGTGSTWEAQLKATEDPAYVQDWIDEHPGGEIRVSEELATKMGLPGSGFSNHDLTLQTDRFLDHLQDVPNDADLWDYAPVIAPLSAAYAIHRLWQRYRGGDLTLDQFRRRAMWVGGLKASKVALITALLAIPGVNAVVATVLLTRLILSTQRSADALLGKLYQPRFSRG